MTLSKPIRFKIESRFSLFVVISWLLMSCIEPDSINSCNFENPLEEVSWLREIVNTLEASMDSVGYEIIRYDYKGSTVFYVNDCFGCSDGIIRVYNCEGEVICEFGGTHGINTCPDFLETATDSTILLDGVTRIKQTSGFLIFEGDIPSDGCGWVLNTDFEKYSPAQLDQTYMIDALHVLVDYSSTNDSIRCGFSNIHYEVINMLSVDEIGKLVVDNEAFNNVPNNDLTIQDVQVSGDWLTISFAASGCSGKTWKVKLVGHKDDIMESDPPQRPLRLSLKNEESCLAVIVKKLVFNIQELSVEGNSVYLNIEGYKDKILYQY